MMPLKLRWLLAASAAVWLTQCASPRNAALRPFESDGCTAFPDGTSSHPNLWQPACLRHDVAYWKGGEAPDRLAADRALRQAIFDSGHPWVSRLAYIGVRLGGVPWLPTPWRWGFGWPYGRGYAPLTESERAQVLAKAPQE